MLGLLKFFNLMENLRNLNAKLYFPLKSKVKIRESLPSQNFLKNQLRG